MDEDERQDLDSELFRFEHQEGRGIMKTEDKQLPTTSISESALSTLILKGDISQLSDTDKLQYYHSICSRLGLDPLTKPFSYLKLQGKEVLYLDKGGAEQLNKLHEVSLSITDSKKVDDIYIVTARAEVKGRVTGGAMSTSITASRHCDSTGAVSIKGLYGDALCNAMMKAETKAKRRATISLLGLAMLDETEIETIPNARTVIAIEEPKYTDTDMAIQVSQEDWDNVKTIGKQNRWPENYMNFWITEQRKKKTAIDVYQEALIRFGQTNEKAEVEV